MNSLWKLLEDGGCVLVILARATSTRWARDRFDTGRHAVRARRIRRDRHREQIRALELEAKRRQLETTHPRPVEPVCGCGHNLAFHDMEGNACHHQAGEATCNCQHYTGPEPLGQVYLPPLAKPDSRAF